MSLEKKDCQNCDGTGKTDTTNPICSWCQGRGWVWTLCYNYPVSAEEPKP